jgi:excisionase family DNA binding protein
VKAQLHEPFDPSELVVYEPESEQVFDNQVLTVREAAKFLKCSTKSLYRLLKFGEIPYRKVGSEYRFLKSSLIDWMKGEC